MYGDSLLAVDVGSSDFGFGGQTHHVGHDAGNGVYGAVETSTSGGWLGHVSENGGYTVNVEYHVMSASSYAKVSDTRLPVDEELSLATTTPRIIHQLTTI